MNLKSTISRILQILPFLLGSFGNVHARWDENWQARLDEIAAIKDDVASFKQTFASDKTFSEQLYGLVDLAAAVSAEERQAMAAPIYAEQETSASTPDRQNGQPPHSDRPASEASQRFANELQNWYETHLTYTELINRYFAKKEAFILEKTRMELLSIYAELPTEKKHEVDVLYADLEDNYQRWVPRQNLITTPDPREQKQRLYSFHGFFVTAQKIGRVLEITPPQREAVSDAPKPRLQQVGKHLSSLRMMVHAGANFFKMLWERERSKFVRTIMSNARAWAEIQGYHVEVEGRQYLDEALAESKRSGQMFMLLPSHRTTGSDAVLLASLGLNNALVFANTVAAGREMCGCWKEGARWFGRQLSDQPDFADEEKMARWIGNKIADNPDVVGVGDCRGDGHLRPAEKMLRSINKQVSKVIINYPQGFVSDSILPTNRAFSQKAVLPLYREGYAPPLIVASYEIESTFLSSDGVSLGKGGVVKLHKPLPATFVELVLAWELRGMPQLLNMMIRSLWLDHIVIYPAMPLELYEQRIHNKIGVHILPQVLAPLPDAAPAS